MSPVVKKIVNIAVDVVVALILALALVLAISTISSRVKGYRDYTEIFGTAFLAVQSDSMAKDFNSGEVKEDNFSKGDLIVIKTLSAEEAKNLQVGDVITFEYQIQDGHYVLNSHRIIEIIGSGDNVTGYTTHGDNNVTGVNETVWVDEIVGVYQGKAGGIGNVMLFMSTSAGFFTCIVLPTLLVVVYSAVNLVLVIRSEKKAQLAAEAQSKEDEREEERRRIREEILAEMQAQSAANANTDVPPEGQSPDGKEQ